MGLLARLWQQAPDPQARAWVLAHPAAAVTRARGRTEEPTDPRLGPAGDELHRGLLTLRRVSLRLLGRLQRGLGAIGPEGVEVLAEAHRLARTDSTEALDRVRTALEGHNG